MPRDAAGAEWGRYFRNKDRKSLKNRLNSKEYAKENIVWKLPDEFLPVKSKKVGFSYGAQSTDWYVNGNTNKQSFVYILTHGHSNIVKYVGLTEDPPRRHMEHRRNNILNGNFVMVIVDIGDEATEKEYIKKYLSDGCELLNKVGITNAKQ